MTTATRRLTRLAVNNADADWIVSASCRTTDPEAFFSESKDERDAARRVCADCPVIVQCLAKVRSRDEATWLWGIGGGLSGGQRRGLRAEELLGGSVNWVWARRLITRQNRHGLRKVHAEARRDLAETVRLLHAAGFLVDEVTVRVALWWLGELATRVPKAATVHGEQGVALLVRDFGPVMRQLRAAGATVLEVAAYLGAHRETTTAAVKVLEDTAGVAA